MNKEDIKREIFKDIWFVVLAVWNGLIWHWGCHSLIIGEIIFGLLVISAKLDKTPNV